MTDYEKTPSAAFSFDPNSEPGFVGQGIDKRGWPVNTYNIGEKFTLIYKEVYEAKSNDRSIYNKYGPMWKLLVKDSRGENVYLKIPASKVGGKWVPHRAYEEFFALRPNVDPQDITVTIMKEHCGKGTRGQWVKACFVYNTDDAPKVESSGIKGDLLGGGANVAQDKTMEVFRDVLTMQKKNHADDPEFLANNKNDFLQFPTCVEGCAQLVESVAHTGVKFLAVITFEQAEKVFDEVVNAG